MHIERSIRFIELTSVRTRRIGDGARVLRMRINYAAGKRDSRPYVAMHSHQQIP